MNQRHLREISVGAAWVLLLGLLAIAAPQFYRGDKLWSIVVGSAPVLVAALGMTLVILTRQIDISIGSQFSICGIVAGLLAQAKHPMPVVWLSALGCGALLGAINGAFIAGLRLPSIVVTLATMVTFRETLRWYREGESVYNLPDWFQWFGMSQFTGQVVIVALAFLIFVAFAWGLYGFVPGRWVYAVGSDQEAARLAGIRPQRVIFGTFVMMGLLSGLAALLNAVRFSEVDPNAGLGLEMQVIAATVVGGVAISGGRGNVIGVLLGVLLLATIGPALVFLGTEAHWEKALQGLIILLAVASDACQQPGEGRS